MTLTVENRTMDDRYEHIAERLVAIEEELRDLAYERLRVVARAPDDDAGVAAAAEEKRLLQARRAIAKAIKALAPSGHDD
jgi:hypothetical protein